MSNTNKNWGLIAKRWLIIILIIALTFGAYTQFYNQMPPTDENAISEQYQEYLEKYDTLKNLSRLAIRQGHGIDVSMLSEATTKYKILSDDKNVTVDYVVNPKFGQDNFSFSAKITLSKDYEILEEKYSDAKELEDFKRSYIFRQHIISLMAGVLIVVALYLGVCMCYGFFHLSKKILKIFKTENKTIDASDTNYPETPTS